MPVEPGMLATPPAQVFLHDAVHRGLIATSQTKRGREHDVAPVVKDAVVITEAHVLCIDGLSFVLFAQDLARLEHLGDEHRSFALRSG
jgi:hypothetical protein